MDLINTLNEGLEKKYFNNMNENYINSLDLCDWEKEELLEYIKDPSRLLMEMSNVRGIDNKLLDRAPFSFYFCNKSPVHGVHGIRVKLLWNPSKNPDDADGYMELHGDYNYVIGSHKYKPTGKELKIARDFFKKYKLLFAAAWEGEIYDGDVQDYFKGRLSFNELLNTFEFIDNYDVESKELYEFYHCKDFEDLEAWVRKYNVFNMND